MTVNRVSVRELGLKIGSYPTGKYNAITDIKGVKIGHSTIIKGKGKLKRGVGPVRTGVTAILPRSGNVLRECVVGGGFILNGAGEVSGLIQVLEWGIIETPILLTNTLSVGTCSTALTNYMVKKHPEIGHELDVILPLVGECDDSWLNDITGKHVKNRHVYQAIKSAKSGPVLQGCVGGGTGMITCDFKGGIGTSSRKLPKAMGGYTVGVLVMSNFGVMKDLRMGGIPVGQILYPQYKKIKKRKDNYGSIIAVVATDAPLLAHQLNRLAKRAALGIGRVGSYAASNSGEIIVAFSTANKVPRSHSHKRIYNLTSLTDHSVDPLYNAVIDATEEAILNSLCLANDMNGVDNHFVPALPLSEIKEIIRKTNAVSQSFAKQ